MESVENNIKEEYEKRISDKKHYFIVAYVLEKFVDKALNNIASIDAYITVKKQNEIQHSKNFFLEMATEALINDIFIAVGAFLDGKSFFIKDKKYERHNCSFEQLRELVSKNENHRLPVDIIISKIDNVMQLYEKKYKDIRDKIIAHNDLEKIFDWTFIDVSIDQIIIDFKEICFECLEIISLCLGFSLENNYETYFMDMLYSINAIVGK